MQTKKAHKHERGEDPAIKEKNVDSVNSNPNKLKS
jgi:hypothetical protein